MGKERGKPDVGTDVHDPQFPPPSIHYEPNDSFNRKICIEILRIPDRVAVGSMNEQSEFIDSSFHDRIIAACDHTASCGL